MALNFRPELLRTVQIVPLTGYDSAGKLALDVMRENTRRLFEAGLRVFIPCAGSSEFHSLSAEEVVSAVGMAREAVGDEAVVMTPIGLQIGHALELGRASLEAGAAACWRCPWPRPIFPTPGRVIITTP